MRYKPIIGLLFASVMLASCAMFRTSCRPSVENKQTKMDSILVIYSDSVDNILLQSSRVHLYDMVDFVNTQDSLKGYDSIFNYQIKKNMGVIGKREKEVLSFIVSDKKWYIKKYAPIRHPFHPNILLEFDNKRGKVFMLVSFVTGEVAIAPVDKQFRFYQMNDARPMIRWAYSMFPNEDYYKELLK